MRQDPTPSIRQRPARLHIFRVILALGLAALGAGCGQRAESPSHGAASTARSDKTFDVGMILDVGGKGDRSVNDSAVHGLELAKHDFGINYEVVEPKSESERESGLRTLAGKNPDLVIAVGSLYSDAIGKIAREFPDRRFACVDYTVPAQGDSSLPFNLRALDFRDEEGAFLVGSLAGYLTRTGRVGFLGGMDEPLTQKIEQAFTAGVHYANSRTEIGPKFVGTTPEAAKDSTHAREMALSLYDAGADIIFEDLGTGAGGVCAAAKERNRFVIGSDTDQWDAAPGLVLTSVVKHVDRAVHETIGAAMEGSFRGGVTRMGLLSGGIELLLDDRNEDLVPKDIRARLDAVRRAIMSKQVNPLKETAGDHSVAPFH